MEQGAPFGPAISLLEFSSIARGYYILDQVVKKAPVRVLEAASVTPGKFFILMNGDEASVEESHEEALRQASQHLLDSVLITQIDEQVLPAMYAMNSFKVEGSLGIVETASIASGIVAADQSRKMASVNLIDLRTARGIGGKSYYFVTGPLEEVQASLDAASARLDKKGMLIRTELIANPHEDFLEYFNLEGTP